MANPHLVPFTPSCPALIAAREAAAGYVTCLPGRRSPHDLFLAGGTSVAELTTRAHRIAPRASRVYCAGFDEIEEVEFQAMILLAQSMYTAQLYDLDVGLEHDLDQARLVVGAVVHPTRPAYFKLLASAQQHTEKIVWAGRAAITRLAEQLLADEKVQAENVRRICLGFSPLTFN